MDYQKWAEKRGLTIFIDNGAAFTIAATIEALERETVKPLSESVLATIGASGYIGGTTIRIVADRKKVKSQIAIARNERKMRLVSTYATILTSDDLSGLAEADIVISSTSSPEPIFTQANCHFLKKDVVFLDVAVPSDFDDAILAIRPDIKLVRCGLIKLPGSPEWKINLHFGSIVQDGKAINLVPACLAEGVLVAVAQGEEYASQGMMIRDRDINFFARTAQEEGFEIITSRVTEADVFGRS